MSKFNIGDRVRLISNRDHLRAGAVGVIADESSIPRVEWQGFTNGHDQPHGDGRKTMWAVSEEHLELIPHEFKAGDLVTIARKVKWEGWVQSLNEYIGQSHKIQSVHKEANGSIHVFIDGWFFPVEALELVPEATIDSLSTDYRKAQAVHTEALARCAAARQQYADAEDELNSASDRLEAAGKALLDAVAKQEG